MCERPKARPSENISEEVREGVGGGERRQDRGGESASIMRDMMLEVFIEQRFIVRW